MNLGDGLAIAGGVAFGWCVAAVTLAALTGTFDAPVWRRTNYRGAELSTGAGMCVVIATVGAWALSGVLLRLIGPDPGRSLTDRYVFMPTVAAAVVGFGILGLIDDVGGVGESGGFKGHLGALAEGRLTTGGLKLLAGPAVALGVVGWMDALGGVVALFRDAALVALAANLMNLLDRAPGRVSKFSGLWFVVLVPFGSAVSLAPAGVVVGATLGLLASDLSERTMLGDVGANAVGAALGVACITVFGTLASWVALSVLLVLNLLSEVVSFSDAIDRIGPLRAFDRWGSLRSK